MLAIKNQIYTFEEYLEIFPSMRVGVPAYQPYRYLDLSALCGRAIIETLGKQDILTNPSLIVEVLSDSTAEFDRGYNIDDRFYLASLDCEIELRELYENVEFPETDNRLRTEPISE